MERGIVKTFCDLAKIPSPSGKEKDAMDYIKGYLKKLNVECLEDNAGKFVKGNSGNLIAKIGNGKPTILFVAHVDTVEDGKRQVKPVIKNGIIKSDGTTILGSDDKSGVAALLEAIKEIKGRKNLPTIFAVFSVNEEKPPMGIKFLNVGKKVDFAFDLDGSDRPGVFLNKALGYASFKIEIFGKEAHAARNPEKGANAIKAAGMIIAGLKLGADSKGTINIGRISGGGALNVVPANAILEGEARAYSIQDIEKRLAGVKKAAKKACKISHCTFKFAKSQEIEPPFPQNNEARIVALAKKAAKSAGLKFSLQAFRATLQANILAKKGYNALAVCRGGRNAHSKKERISIKELAHARDLVVKIVEQAGEKEKKKHF